MIKNIKIEGESIQDILEWTDEEYDTLILIDRPIVIHIGSAEVLGQFVINEGVLVVELAQIDGGGEGVLPVITKVAKHIAKRKSLQEIHSIVHAINCAKPNLKLQVHLEKIGFKIKDIPHKGEAYFKVWSV
jgi:hypothetical protein